MFELINFQSIPVFLLIFVRVTSFFVTIPIFSYKNIPTSHKIGSAFFLSYLIFYTIPKPTIDLGTSFLLLVIKESIIGLSIGLVAYMIISAIRIAGGFIDFQMGFAIANVIDPQTGTQSPLMGQYLYTFAIIFLLLLDGHHLLLDGIFYSYQLIPLNQLTIPFGEEGLVLYIARTFNTMFVIAFQMSIPIVGALFLVDVALGIIARTVPQLNIFVVGIPVKILVSFVVLFVFLPVFFVLTNQLFDQMLVTMRGIMAWMGGV